MVDEKILTLHPDPDKKGVHIDKGKYEQVWDASVRALERSGGLTFMKLMEAVEADVQGRFEESVGCYGTTVKLDLEARGLVRREGKSPQVVVGGLQSARTGEVRVED